MFRDLLPLKTYNGACKIPLQKTRVLLAVQNEKSVFKKTFIAEQILEKEQENAQVLPHARLEHHRYPG